MGKIAKFSGSADYQKTKLYLIRLLALLLPFSWEVPLSKSTMLAVPTEPIIVILALLFVADIIGNPQQYKRLFMREWLWLISLATAFALSTIFSTMPLVSLKFSFINALFIFVFLAGFTRLFTQHPDLPRELFLIFTASLTLVLCWGLYRYWHWDWNPVVVRGIFQPFFKDHTLFGASAALLAACWLGHALLAGRGRSRFFFLLVGLVCIACVLVSSSRAAFLSLLFAAGVYVLLRLRIRPVYLLVGGMLAVSLLWFARMPLLARMQQVEVASDDPTLGWAERTGTVANITTDVSNLERLNRWVSAWRMFREKPLTGFGPGTYQFEYIPFQAPSLMNRLTVTYPFDVPEGSGGTAHSEYLLALSEMGIMGLIGWLALIFRFAWIAFSRWQREMRHPTIDIVFIALATYLFHAFFNNFLTTDKFAFLFWGMAAWMLAGNRLAEQQAGADDRATDHNNISNPSPAMHLEKASPGDSATVGGMMSGDDAHGGQLQQQGRVL